MAGRHKSSLFGTIVFLVLLLGGIGGGIYWYWTRTIEPQRALERIDRLMNMRAYQEALDVTNKAIKVSPNNGEIRLRRAQALQGVRRYEEAIREYDTAVRLKPELITAHRIGVAECVRLLEAQYR